MPVAAAIGAGLGAIGGAIKSGPQANMEGRRGAADSLNAFRNLVAKGPGEQDVGAATGAAREFAGSLQNLASSSTGMFNFGAGNQLAEQAFAGQRQALQQSLTDQMAQANRAAAQAGRSTNDPIVQARLRAEAMRAQQGLAAQQSAAAVDFARQSVSDQLNLQSSRVNTLQGLAQQAFANQQNLFGMNQNLFQMDLGAAQYEQSRGGGLKGALTGAVTGAGAGLNFAQGMAGMDFMNSLSANPIAAQQISALNNFQMGPNQSLESIVGAGAKSFASGVGQGMGQSMAAPAFNPAYFNPANFAGAQTFGPQPAPPRMGQSSVFGPNSFSFK